MPSSQEPRPCGTTSGLSFGPGESRRFPRRGAGWWSQVWLELPTSPSIVGSSLPSFRTPSGRGMPAQTRTKRESPGSCDRNGSETASVQAAAERGRYRSTTQPACGAARRKRGGLVSPRAVPRFHCVRRHPSSPGRRRDRSGGDDDKAPYPCHDRGTKTCSAGRDGDGGREGDRWLVDSRARSFPGLQGGLDAPQEVHPDPRESLQNMDSLLQAGRIPCLRLLSRRRWVWRGLGPLAQPRERQDPGHLGSRALRRLAALPAARDPGLRSEREGRALHILRDDGRGWVGQGIES
jgi:hypothetical protein